MITISMCCLPSANIYRFSSKTGPLRFGMLENWFCSKVFLGKIRVQSLWYVFNSPVCMMMQNIVIVLHFCIARS